MPDHRFAAVSMTGSRNEIDAPARLPALAGHLPEGLAGQWFVVFPVGDAASPLPPVHDPAKSDYRGSTTPFLNGDGCIARITFGAGAAMAIKRIIRTPCWEVDRHLESVGKARFKNFGLTRQSLRFGARNFANTALQLVRVGGEVKLVATYDAGPPTILDPRDLDVRGVIGGGDQWIGQISKSFAFRLVSSTAHPAWDGGAQILYLLEYGRTLVSFVASLSRLLFKPKPRLERADVGPLDPATWEVGDVIVDHEAHARTLVDFDKSDRDNMDAIKRWLDDNRARSYAAPGEYIPQLEASDAGGEGSSADAKPSVGADDRELLDAVWRRIDRAVDIRDRLIASDDALAPNLKPPFLRIMSWSVRGLRQREIRTHDGKRIEIRNSSHMMAVTQSFVLVVDTAFKFEVDLAMPHPKDPPRILQWLRLRLSAPQPLTARVYVVRRADLDADGDAPVRAVGFKLAAEVVHFLVDFDDAGGTRITFHALDNRASDPAEFVLSGDRRGFGATNPIDERVHGMMPSGLDTNAMQSFALDVPPLPPVAGRLAGVDHDGFLRAEPLGRAETTPGGRELPTWTLALGSGLDVAGLRPAPRRYTDSFWYGHGLSPEMVNQITSALYTFDDDPGGRRRTTPMSVVRDLARRGGLPGGLFHLRHDASGRKWRVLAAFEAPPGVMFTSPQFIAKTPGSQSDGWLVCAAWRDVRILKDAHDRPFAADERAREIWVFDVAKLAAGPLCRIDATRLEWPYTLHTAWLDAADVPSEPPPPLPKNDGRPGFRRQDFSHVTDKKTRALLEAALGWPPPT